MVYSMVAKIENRNFNCAINNLNTSGNFNNSDHYFSDFNINFSNDSNFSLTNEIRDGSIKDVLMVSNFNTDDTIGDFQSENLLDPCGFTGDMNNNDSDSIFLLSPNFCEKTI